MSVHMINYNFVFYK